jgi:uncharacterized repeat protein (TIGR02059 family)
MKRLLLIPLFLISLMSSAATYYVSPTGSDASGNGSIGSPWFTLNKAWSSVTAGDIIYMRGGTYYYTSAQNLTGKSGNSSSYINVWNYAGENPIIDASKITDYEIVNLGNASYIYMKGIRLTNLKQPNPITTSNGYYGLRINPYTTSSKFELIETDHVGGWGVVIFDYCKDLLFLNCDSHHNADPYTETYAGPHGTNYGGADGFETGYANTTNITFKGCRAWWNSDDGWDFRQAAGTITLDNCWSFWNGNIPGTFTPAGDGEGFKLGSSFFAPDQTAIRRIVKNSMSFENQAGVEAVNEGYYVGVQIYNSVFYKNTAGINIQRPGASTTILRNNISYNNSQGNWIDSWVGHDHNSWDIGKTVTDADFMSVSSVGADGPRQADGSLPNLNFMRLKTGSALINAGVDVGLAFAGSAPDLGAYETSLTGTSVIAPSYLSSAVDNSTPLVLGMTYDQTLATIVPAASSFAVKVNSVARTVNSITISGSKVLLTLASPVVNGDVITTSYTKPATNPLQTTAGGQAASLTDQPVTNNVSAIVLPVYVSSVVQNATPTSLDMTYSLSLANVLPATTSFNVIVNSVARSVSSVTISGTKVTLKLASAVVSGDVISVSYTKPATNPLQATTGAQAATLVTQTVTNSVTPTKDATAPSITMTITSNFIHHIVNITLKNITTALSPELIRILDMSGKLYVEKLLVTGVTSVKIPVSLNSGVYSVILMSGGFQVASKKIVVY